MAKEEAEKTKKVKVPTAQKRVLQNEKKRLANKMFKAKVRTAVRRFEESLPKKDAAVISESLSTVYSLMDKGVKTGVYKLNKACRAKSRLASAAAAAK